MPSNIASSVNKNYATFLEDAAFSVSSRVALQLGRESISSSIIAVVELVKNAYDADAEDIHIRFANLGTSNAMLVIEDTGDGMTVDELKNKWMIIGTSNKADRRKTSKQRIVTGEKGLGRLGLDRLCHTTIVESMKLDATYGLRLEVEWKLYEQNESRLEAIKHKIYSINDLCIDPITKDSKVYPKGMRLVLHGLKDEWDKNSIEQLRNELALLVSPFQAPNDFSIYITTEGVHEELEGLVYIQKPLLDASSWKVIASLDDDDRIEITMSSERHDTKYRMEATPWVDAIKRQGLKAQCGPVRMEFYFFQRRQAELTDKTIRSNEISAFLNFNQGIRIYRDGFRVKPYGEPNGHGDWLKLAYRRMQSPEGVKSSTSKIGGWRVGYNQVVGAVFITHEKNADLLDQTNREGLLQGKAFDHLGVFAHKVIQFFEIHNQTYELGLQFIQIPVERAEISAKNSIQGASNAIKDITELVAKLPQLAKTHAGNNEVAEAATNAEEITRVIDKVQKQLDVASTDLANSTKLFKEVEEQKNTMSNLASLGILAAAFGHETLDWTGTVVKNARWLLENLVKGTFMVHPNVEDEIKATLTDTASEAQKIRKFARFTLGNLNREKRRRKSFNIVLTVNRVFDAFDDVLRVQRNTAIDLTEVPLTACFIDGYEMDWESVIVNLITNSSWALEDISAECRKIKVAIVDSGDHWKLSFADSGVGLESGTEDMIFLPAYSTKRGASGEFIGTGMGLFIVKSFVEEHSNGVISVNPKGHLGGATFEIAVPKSNKALNGDVL